MPDNSAAVHKFISDKLKNRKTFSSTINGGYPYFRTTASVGGISATGVSLNTNSLILPLNAAETLTATVARTNTADKTVFWTTSDAAVASVSIDGKVSALSVGTAIITA